MDYMWHINIQIYYILLNPERFQLYIIYIKYFNILHNNVIYVMVCIY